MSVEQIILLVLGLWLLLLTTMFFLRKRFFDNLVKDLGEKKLERILKEIIDKQKTSRVEFERLEKKLDSFIDSSRFHVQKLGLVRFNPFKEIGGDHSFSICILNGKNDGFVITGLHTRDRTRVYTKPIRRGKSKLNLSNEETKALSDALKNKNI